MLGGDTWSEGESRTCPHIGVGVDWTFAAHGDSDKAGFLARSVGLLISIGGLCVTALMLVRPLALSEWHWNWAVACSSRALHGHGALSGGPQGIVSEQIANMIEDLKKGRSEVLETGHTLILGWSDKVCAILQHQWLNVMMCRSGQCCSGYPLPLLETT